MVGRVLLVFRLGFSIIPALTACKRWVIRSHYRGVLEVNFIRRRATFSQPLGTSENWEN